MPAENVRSVRRIPLLMTRPAGANSWFHEAFSPDLKAQLEFVECPLMRIVSLEQQNSMEGQAIAIFTSSNGVRFAPPSLQRRAFCIGQRTTAKAQAAGWRAECAGRCAEDLIDHIAAINPSVPLYHFSGVHVRGDIAARLRARGMSVERIALYDQLLLPLPAQALEVLARPSPAIVPLFSPRAASHFAQIAPKNPLIVLVALSAAVAEAGKCIPCHKSLIVDQPNADAMIDCLEKLVPSMRLG